MIFRKYSDFVNFKLNESKKEDMDNLIKIYKYAYPLVLMAYTKRTMTNLNGIEDFGKAPINMFANISEFPDSNFKDVVRPNVDTFYSIVWFDLKKEPIFINIPNIEEYYLMPILDGYTNVISSTGDRTKKVNKLLLVGPEYEGDIKVDKGIEVIKSTTNMNWLIGRIRVDDKKSSDAVSKLQKELYTSTLSDPETKIENTPYFKKQDDLIPMEEVENMNFLDFMNYFLELLVDNPPYDYDKEIIDLMDKYNIKIGSELNSKDLIDGVDDIPNIVYNEFREKSNSKEGLNNGWFFISDEVGEYKNNYDLRAYISYIGLGANLNKDSIYPNTSLDSDLEKLNSKNDYKITFDKDKLPPVKGFWSLTIYDKKGFLVENDDKKYAIQQSDNLEFNEDGSLDIYIQSEEHESKNNWLPSPKKDGEFELTFRFYYPENTIIEGKWDIPEVIKNKNN